MEGRVTEVTQTLDFTIVELLIVVVVIAVLAGMVVVSYNGVTRSAKETALKSDLKGVSTQLELALLKTKSLPDTDGDLKVSADTRLEYKKHSRNSYCATARNGDLSFYIDSISNRVQVGECVDPTIQDFTQSACSALAVYTGGNPAALVSLNDTRGGVTQTYMVGKLADNNCWMLDNLKLGSTSGTIILTPADSNVASNFTLPQVKNTGSTAFSGVGNGHDTPYVYGPVPGDTSSGVTKYGYLYNWSAATAGETITSHPQTAGNAPFSVCPKNWRLPTGGGGVGDFAHLDRAFGGTGFRDSPYEINGPSIARWQFAGPFRGVFAGIWSNTYYAQDSSNKLWSSSAHPGSSGYALDTHLGSNFIYPGDADDSRHVGHGVRCLLN